MRRNSIVVLLATVTIILSCKPDLVVTTFEKTGNPSINPTSGSVEVPVRVIVKNQGVASAGIFKVCTEYTGPNGSYLVAFTVPGQQDMWYPYTSADLAENQSVTFDGKVVFHPEVHGVNVTLKAIADCCRGDEFKPEYCRIHESNEANNDSHSISVSLP